MYLICLNKFSEKMHLIFPKKKLFDLLGCSINTLRTIVSAGELKLQKKVCNIMDLEVNQKIYPHLGDGVMDMCQVDIG